MSSGEYLFTLIIGTLYTSAWWSLFIFPTGKTNNETFETIRFGFLVIFTIFIFLFTVEKLVKENDKHE